MSRVTPEVNTLLNLQVEQQAVRNDAQSHADFSLFFESTAKILKLSLMSGLKTLLNRY